MNCDDAVIDSCGKAAELARANSAEFAFYLNLQTTLPYDEAFIALTVGMQPRFVPPFVGVMIPDPEALRLKSNLVGWPAPRQKR